jgi:translocation and assembly module TamB
LTFFVLLVRMMNDSLPPPPDDVDGGTPPGPPQPPRRRRHRALRALTCTAGVIALVAVLAALALYGALTTERGTRLAWRAAVAMSGGQLSGTLVGGTLAGGVQLADVRWRSGEGGSREAAGSVAASGAFAPGTSAAANVPAAVAASDSGAAAATSGGTDVRIDRLSGRWALTRAPWRFTIVELRAATIEVRLAPSRNNAPLTLPTNLRLPFELDIRSLAVERLRLLNGASATEYDRLRLSGRTDGRHHTLAVSGVDTPYGAVTAQLSLDGARPFALVGDATYAGALADEPVQLAAHLSGTLEALVADVKASGFKLAGHAHLEAEPFGAVPVKRAKLSFVHVNPQTFSPGAPFADLSVEAELAPVAGPRGGPFIVAGPVSIVNAKPGSLEARLVPLVDAHADVRLDAREQRIENLRAKLIHDAMLSGGGTLAHGRGRIALQATGLDLNVVTPYVRPTALDGPIGISLDGATQQFDFDLTDEHAKLGARARVTFDRTRIGLHGARLRVGAGHVELDGTLARDARKTYDLRAALTDFDPRLLMASQQQTRAAAGASPATAMGSRGASPAGGARRDEGQATRPPAQTTAEASAQTAAQATRAALQKTQKMHKTASAKTLSLPQARVTGTLTATGTLAPVFATKLRFELGESVYAGFPLTGSGTVQLAGARLLPSDAKFSVAGNEVELRGSFGARGDRLRFHVAAPSLDRLGFGLAGMIVADADLTGSLAHPDATLSYDAKSVVFGANRVGSATGRASIRDGATGALELTTDARDVHMSVVDFATFSAHASGTRAKHVFDAAGQGTMRGRPVDLTLAASGGFTETRDGPRWNGVVTRLANRGVPALELQTPLVLTVAREVVTVDSTRLTLEGAHLDLKSFAYDHGALRSAGSAGNLSLGRLLAMREELTGTPSPVKSDLVFAGDWDFALGRTASGYARIERVSGDLSVDAGRGGLASLGMSALAARVEASGGQRVTATLHAAASRIGTADANAVVPLAPDAARAGLLGVAADAPLSGAAAVDVPSLETTGGLFGPSYLLGGSVALKLALAGTRAKPSISGLLTGDRLSATFVDQGLQLRDGVVHVALSENLVDFQHVEFHGGDGTLRATGKIRLDGAQPDLTAQLVADKLELFAAPDRQLSLSGSATVANGGPAGGIEIDGKFKVDHALFDMPDQPAPRLSDDVVIARENSSGGLARGAPPPAQSTMTKPVGAFAPRATIDIDLGSDFRFRGRDADLGLRGTVTALSAPMKPLRAIGNVRVTEGSTYTSFGRKLTIENGFFTFNGPMANPGINILAIRRNQDVEAGVQVTGTVNAPVVKLVSEPNVPDDEKISWLLFGHGTDQGNNLGQQSTMTTALALLGSATGKRVAKTIGLDEFTVGRSEVGLTDAQVVMLSKAINERLVLGYEQGLQSASNAFKVTINLSRFWSVSGYGGTFQGFDIGYTRRFDGLSSRR